jgi:uncharacterized repeat protein (TIGR01451 family)
MPVVGNANSAQWEVRAMKTFEAASFDTGLRPTLRALLVVGILLLSVQPASALNSAASCDGTANDPVTCTGRTAPNGKVCMGDLSGFGTGINCTANDVSIGFADNIRDSAGTLIASCTQGSTLNATGDFHVETSGGVTRYDLGLFFATDGDPNHDGAKSGGCSVTKIGGPNPTNNVSNNFLQLDASPDTCGDINNANKPQIVRAAFSIPCVPSPQFFNPATNQCQATAPSGVLNPKHCVSLPNGTSWRQTGANNVCDSPIDTFPGTTSKCNVNPSFGIPVTIEDAKVGVEKTANPTSVPEPGGTVKYTVKVTNNAPSSNLTITSVIDDPYGNLGTNTPPLANNTCPGLIGAVLVPGGFTTCSFDAPVSGNAGTSAVDVVTACGNSSGGGAAGCGTGSATVGITDVSATPTLTKAAKSYTVVVTYEVQVNNNSAFDSLKVNSLCDDKFGDLTGGSACGAGPFPDTFVSTSDCDEVVGSTIPPSGHATCSFVGSFTDVTSHTNTVTGDVTDDDNITSKPSDNATVNISIP